MEEFKVTELINGRPDFQISDKEKDCYDLLEELNIEYERVDFNKVPETVDDAIKIEEKIKVPACKNLVFQNRNKSETYMIITPREYRIDKKLFASTYNTTRIAMVEDNELERLLNTHPGAVSITELMYDKDNNVKVFISKKVLEQEYFRFHPNENKSLLRIKMKNFDKLFKALNHKYEILELNEEE